MTTTIPVHSSRPHHPVGRQPVEHKPSSAKAQTPEVSDGFDSGRRSSTASHDRKVDSYEKPNGTNTHVKVPWWSQFQGGHPFKAGPRQCYAAAKAMARAGGANEAGVSQRIQVATGEDKNGRIAVNKKAAEQGNSYLDSQLDKGKPVVVGVSYKHAHYNVDKVTDHFVTVTGRGTDDKGRTYYTFNDPGTRHADKGRDTNPNNRLYVDPQTHALYRPGANSGSITGRHYDVSMVRRNS